MGEAAGVPPGRAVLNQVVDRPPSLAGVKAGTSGPDLARPPRTASPEMLGTMRETSLTVPTASPSWLSIFQTLSNPNCSAWGLSLHNGVLGFGAHAGRPGPGQRWRGEPVSCVSSVGVKETRLVPGVDAPSCAALLPVVIQSYRGVESPASRAGGSGIKPRRAEWSEP